MSFKQVLESACYNGRVAVRTYDDTKGLSVVCFDEECFRPLESIWIESSMNLRLLAPIYYKYMHCAVYRNFGTSGESFAIDIGDEEAEVLAESLSGNCALKVMALSNCGQDSKLQGYQPRNSITPKGWAALSNVVRVCNHTLQSVTDPDKPRPQVSRAVSNELESTYELEYLLKMNSKDDKRAVAQQKAILIKDIIVNSNMLWKRKRCYQTFLPAFVVRQKAKAANLLQRLF